jgi:hypothetical protein
MVKPDKLVEMASMLQVENDDVVREALLIIKVKYLTVTTALATMPALQVEKFRREIKDELKNMLSRVGVTDRTAGEISDYMSKIDINPLQR